MELRCCRWDVRNTALASVLAIVVARAQEERRDPVEVGSLDHLRALAPAWFAAMQAADAAELRDRARTVKASNEARDAFDAALAAYDARHTTPLLCDVDALRTVFANVFLNRQLPEREGDVRSAMAGEGDARRAEWLPADIAADSWHRTVLLLGGSSDCGDEASLQAFVTSMWGEAAARDRSIVVAPALPAALELDELGKSMDPAKAANSADERLRIRASLLSLGEASRTLPIDRDRIVVDCGRGASRFGIRLAGYFPDRFAGLVLRWPQEVDGGWLRSMAGMPVLLVRCDETAAACATLHDELEQIAPGTCRILTPRSVYPFANDPGIGEWARQQRRDLFAPRIVLAPVHPHMRKNRWVWLRAVESGGWLRAEVDREQNRITVTTHGVDRFGLRLGPALVDVRDFVLVVDGEERSVRLQPSLEVLKDSIQQSFDPDALFTQLHEVEVPR